MKIGVFYFEGERMKYLESSQIIPNKGMSYTLYEIEGKDKILRMITSIARTKVVLLLLVIRQINSNHAYLKKNRKVFDIDLLPDNL